MGGVLAAILGSVSQGVLWGIMTLGVYITFKVLNYADLSVDGTFATGGAVTAVLITNGMNPFLSLIFAILAGCLAGTATGLFTTKLEIPPILAGILTMIAMYSVNIRIMGDKSNLPLLGKNTVFSIAVDMFGLSKAQTVMIVGWIFALIIIFILYLFFGTEIGSLIRATGNNEYMVRAQGGNTKHMVVLGVLVSNGMVSLSGALVAQSQGYADVGMGIGTIVIGLASIIIGEVIFGTRFSFLYKLVSVVIGSVIYRVIIAVVLQLGMKSTDLKLLTAIMVAFALSIPVVQNKLAENKNRKANMTAIRNAAGGDHNA